jgi:hypothetical protein
MVYEGKRGRNHQAYMWQYSSPGKGLVFDFRMGREGEGPKQFLGNFNGLVQTDGYKGYNHVGGPKMVHARRKYVDAVKVNAKDQESADGPGTNRRRSETAASLSRDFVRGAGRSSLFDQYRLPATCSARRTIGD